MKFKKKNLKNQKWFAYTVATCAAVLLFVTLSNLHIIWGGVKGILGVLSPVIEGVIFAYIMQPVCALFERTLYRNVKSRRIAHLAAVATGVVCVVLVFIILIVALVPQVVDSIVTFVANMGVYARQLSRLLMMASVMADERGVDISKVVEGGNEFVNNLIISIPDRANGFLTASYNFGVSIANILLAFVLAIYFLIDMENLLEGVRKLLRALLPPKQYHAWAEFWSRCNKILIRYITFDIVDGFIIGVCNFVFMLCLSMPYAVLISVVVGVTNLAPTFGPIVGGLIGAFVLALAKPVDALIFILFTMILQALDGYIIKPRLFGSSLGVPAVWILVTIIVGGNLFGVIGILLAIPFAAIMTYVYRDFLEKRIEEQTAKQIAKEEKKKEKEASEEASDVAT